VPCGQFARQVLLQSGITPAIDTNERDVRALLTKVEAGELDAAIVYETDVLSSGGAVEGIDIPEGQNVVATYPLVALAEAGAPEVAAAFVELVLSDDGLQILESYGFRAP
jgi:molybdate transport system substrate-binding protein